MRIEVASPCNRGKMLEQGSEMRFLRATQSRKRGKASFESPSEQRK